MLVIDRRCLEGIDLAQRLRPPLGSPAVVVTNIARNREQPWTHGFAGAEIFA